MNKFQKEMLEKCKEVKISEELPLLDDIYILPTNRKHDSGYKIMYIVGLCREKGIYYLLDNYCDVVDLGDFGTLIQDLHIDILDNGIIHYWSNSQQFKSIHRMSSCTFEIINRKKMLWEK